MPILLKEFRHSEETKRKMRIANFRGNYGFKKGQVSLRKGKKYPQVSGGQNWNWKGRTKTTNGYILLYSPNHPFSYRKYVAEHRLVVEKYLGRYLKPKERVHHINEITDDNRIENLMVFRNWAYHFWYHKKGFCNPVGIIFDGRKLKKKL